MQFIGQPTIMAQLSIYLPFLLENPAEGMSFFVSGPSGWGKTRLCLLSCNYLAENGQFQYCIPDDGAIRFQSRFHVHFFDEAHLIQRPELLYPIMDSNRHVIFLATNESGSIAEPLLNRCTPLTFEPYAMTDLIEIAKGSYRFPVSDAFLQRVVVAGAENPRIIVRLCKRLAMYSRTYGIPDDVDKVMEDFFGIIDGIDVVGQRYLEFLRRLGGTASIDTLTSGLHVSKSLLLYQVEPVLLYKGLVKITSKGRTLCE